MHTSPICELKLPDPDAIRDRLDALDDERKLLKDLLRTIIRIEGRRVQPRISSPETEATSAVR